MRRLSAAAVLALIVCGPEAGPVRAQAGPALARALPAAPGTLPDERQYLDRSVPDILVHTSRGSFRLSTLWQQGPVLVTLVFTRCAGVCSPFLRSLRSADEALGAPADVWRVVLSFDPRDTVEDMQRTAGHLGVADRRGWLFGTASPADIDDVARAFGFWSVWSDVQQQFDHPAMVVGIRRGAVARLLAGGSVTSARLGEVVREARGQFVASYPLPGAVRFRCFDYDPASGRATIAAGTLLLLVPALGAAAMTFGLFRWTNRSRT